MKIESVGTEEVKNFLVDTFVPATDASQLPSSGPKNYMASPQLKLDMACYARLAKFLSDKEAVGRAAAQLDGLLWGLVKDLDRQSWLGVGDLFLEALRRVGAAYGFNLVYCYALYRQVSPEAFRWVVSQKSLFHDAFTRRHGEYTHAVQWLLMAVRFESSDLNARIADLYARSVAYISKEGKQFITRLTKDGKPIYERIYLWNFLVDCFPGPDENYKANIRCQTYRCPQYVTNKFVGLSPESWLGRHLIRLRWLGCNRGEPPPSPRYDRKRLKKGNISYTPRDIAENLQSGLWEQTGYPNVYRVVPPRILVH